MRNKKDERAIVKKLKDDGRIVSESGNEYLVSHKFTPSGEVVDATNFNPANCISKLNLNDIKLLVLWRENKWDDQKTLSKAQLSPDQAERTLKKLAYFKSEDAKIRALAGEATVERVLAKDMENLESGNLSDTHHKSLDRIAKIRGGFRGADESGSGVVNIFNFPKMSPETEAELRAIAKRELAQEAEIVQP